MVQSRSVRGLDNYTTITSTEYYFDGSVAQQLTEQGTENNLVREHYRYTYDHAGRAKIPIISSIMAKKYFCLHFLMTA